MLKNIKKIRKKIKFGEEKNVKLKIINEESGE